MALPPLTATRQETVLLLSPVCVSRTCAEICAVFPLGSTVPEARTSAVAPLPVTETTLGLSLLQMYS